MPRAHLGPVGARGIRDTGHGARPRAGRAASAARVSADRGGHRTDTKAACMPIRSSPPRSRAASATIAAAGRSWSRRIPGSRPAIWTWSREVAAGERRKAAKGMVASSGTTIRARAVGGCSRASIPLRTGTRVASRCFLCAFLLIRAVRTTRVDSNSTRTEPCVEIRLDPEVRGRSRLSKTLDHNGDEEITSQSPGMPAGLKILVSVS
jgi:hypothetical protein